MDIRLRIGKKPFVIYTDSSNFILAEVCIKGEGSKPENVGKEWFRDIAFSGTLKSMFEIVLKKKLLASDAHSIDELQRDLKQYKDEIQGVYDGNLT